MKPLLYTLLYLLTACHSNPGGYSDEAWEALPEWRQEQERRSQRQEREAERDAREQRYLEEWKRQMWLCRGCSVEEILERTYI